MPPMTPQHVLSHLRCITSMNRKRQKGITNNPVVLRYSPLRIGQGRQAGSRRWSVGLFHQYPQFLDIALPVFEGKGTTAGMLFKTQRGG
jgi:hypothetical protein